MDFVSNVMFWISNSLLVPVMVGLVLLFLLSLVMIGSLLAEQQKQRQKKIKYEHLFQELGSSSKLLHLRQSLSNAAKKQAFEGVALALFDASPAQRDLLIGDFELRQQKSNTKGKLLAKFGPILGLMGTLIPMGPALVDLSTGEVASMAYNMQVAFATTVLGMFSAAVGYFYLQLVTRYQHQDLLWLDYLNESLTEHIPTAAQSKEASNTLAQ